MKFSFAVMTALLLYEEFYVFFVEQPTHTSSPKLHLGQECCVLLFSVFYLIHVSDPDLYPYIDVCPFPTYDQENLKIRALSKGEIFLDGVATIQKQPLEM